MFNKNYLATAICCALACQSVQAEEIENEKDSKAEKEVIEVIEVKGLRYSLNKALNIKRQNLQLVDAIVSEDIGKFPDNNVVEALQRVTGVQVTDRGAGEVSTVSIRGLNDVTTTINGRNIFTASGRSVALQDIPASLLRGVDIYKTRSANLIESGIAGVIDIHTQRPFDFDDSKVVVAARAIRQEEAGKSDPNISMLLSDRWQLNNSGEFGALVNVSYAKTNYRDQSITPGAMVPFVTQAGGGGFGPLERLFSGWQAGTEAGLPSAAGSTMPLNGEEVEYYLARDAIFGADVTGERKRPAANVALQFAPNDQSEYIFEAFYNGYRNEQTTSLQFSFADWWGDAGSLPAPVLFPGTNIIKERLVNNPYAFTSGDSLVGKTDSYVYALGGNWEISNNLTLNSELVYQKSTFEDEFLAMRFDRVHHQIDVDFNDSDGLPALTYIDNPATEIDESDITNPELWNVAQMWDNGSERQGSALTWTLDGEYLFEDMGWLQNVKFGINIDNRKAYESSRGQDSWLGGNLAQHIADGTFGEDLLMTSSGFFSEASNFNDSWIVADADYLFGNTADVRNTYGLTEQALYKNFEIDEKQTSLYVMTDFATEINGQPLDGQIGVRYVNAKTDMTFNKKSDDSTSYDDASVSSVLPSLAIRYGITDDINLRFTYGETLRRPGFADLNSNITYFEDVTNIGYGTGSGGNPNLKPTESTNIDLAAEWYFADTSSIYGTIFKRDIDGFVIGFRNRQYYAGDADIDAGDYVVSQPDNASDGELKGFEVGMVYFPENLPEYLDGFGIQASYTSLSSSQTLALTDDSGNVVGETESDLPGVSDTSYSTVFIYEKEDFDMRLSYVYREAFFNNNEAALFANPLQVWRRPETSVDFQLSYDVSENMTVTFDATNLTDELTQSYYGKGNQNTHNFGNAILSRTFALGVRYSM
ncbi:TonB-dependent receptor [Thalassotalea sp. G2M2-11]|uniref:TonB-dependent receptor n=1 Tax=Thalassotalea sp. G2M2-11 TaxID=2787627 RepID=UPI0019D07039|nr:TonB-dependent receptor [Thalassotalea sp. G2M2-11]